MRVIFFGTPQFAADILKSLLDEVQFKVVGVVCQPDEPVGRKKILTAPPTKQLAVEQNIPVFQPTKLKDDSFLADVDALKTDVAVIVAYGRILPKTLLDRIPRGFINVHPSLLPKYRGPSPMQAAIANGDEKTGVTIMKIDEGMDTGPILAQTSIEIAPDETTSSLTTKVVNVGAPILIEALKGYMDGSITPTPQSGEPSLCKLLSREDGKIDWNQDAKTIDQKIRAHTPWPGAWSVWNIRSTEVQVKIFSATSSTQTTSSPIGIPTLSEGKLLVNTGANSSLQILEVQPAGGNRMTGDAFARGYLK